MKKTFWCWDTWYCKCVCRIFQQPRSAMKPNPLLFIQKCSYSSCFEAVFLDMIWTHTSVSGLIRHDIIIRECVRIMREGVCVPLWITLRLRMEAMDVLMERSDGTEAGRSPQTDGFSSECLLPPDTDFMIGQWRPASSQEWASSSVFLIIFLADICSCFSLHFDQFFI